MELFYGTAHFVFSGTTQCCVVNNTNDSIFATSWHKSHWSNECVTTPKTKPECIMVVASNVKLASLKGPQNQ